VQVSLSSLALFALCLKLSLEAISFKCNGAHSGDHVLLQLCPFQGNAFGAPHRLARRTTVNSKKKTIGRSIISDQTPLVSRGSSC